MKMEDFRKELQSLLNRYSWDTRTDIPDFLLAQSLCATLVNLELTMQTTREWHGWPSLADKLELDKELKTYEVTE